MKTKPVIKIDIIHSSLISLKGRKKITSFEKFKGTIQSLITNSFYRKDFIREDKILSILGCTYEEFKEHIEKKFLPWMCWENHGKYDGQLNSGWDIDHIIPVASAQSIEELIQLNHYTNFQPLCSKTNRFLKKDKVTFS